MINLQNLSFCYSSVTVLNGINLKLEPGRIYGLLGENGVGKTTLLSLLSGLKKPQSGRVDCDGYIPYERRPEYLSSLFFLQDEVAPIRSKASEWAKVSGAFWPDFDFEEYLTIMSEFENDPEKRLSEMSAGQLKKTYISFALACKTAYLFMDEPTNGLDIPGKAQFRSAIMKHSREDATIVISTHQVRDLENIIDPIVILDSNEVLLNASLECIAQKLFFDYGTIPHPESLFTEQLPGGLIQVYQNISGEESKVNIEALFNASINHKDIIKAIFTDE